MANVARAEKINKLARNIITYFVIELIMPIGALVLIKKKPTLSVSVSVRLCVS